MPIAGRVHIDATVNPTCAKGIIIYAPTQKEAEEELAMLLAASAVPETPAVHYPQLTHNPEAQQGKSCDLPKF
jgi:hypothetical protein